MTENDAQKIDFFSSQNRNKTNHHKFSAIAIFVFIKNLFFKEKSTTSPEQSTRHNILSTEIKNISDNDFQQFNKYLLNQKHFYDDKVNYLANVIIEAQQDWIAKGNGNDNRNIVTIEFAKHLKEQLVKYHNKIDSYINHYSKTYNTINLGMENELLDINLENFLEKYNLFKNNNYTTDKELESSINSVLFSQKSGTIAYFQENDVYNKAMSLEKKNINNTTQTIVKKGMYK